MGKDMSARVGSAFGGDFKKDILLIDLEFSGIDPKKHEIIQFGAILLDKENLEEKKTFSSYIRPAKWKHRDPESMKINRITWQQVARAPSLKEVIKDFTQAFPPDVVLSYYGGPLDMDFLRAAYKKVKQPFPFDYHYFNLWGVFFTYLGLKGKSFDKKKFSGFSLDDFLRHFKISIPKDRHDALVDCRLEAEVFRRIIKELK